MRWSSHRIHDSARHLHFFVLSSHVYIETYTISSASLIATNCNKLYSFSPSYLARIRVHRMVVTPGCKLSRYLVTTWGLSRRSASLRTQLVRTVTGLDPTEQAKSHRPVPPGGRAGRLQASQQTSLISLFYFYFYLRALLPGFAFAFFLFIQLHTFQDEPIWRLVPGWRSQTERQRGSQPGRVTGRFGCSGDRYDGGCYG